MNAEERFETWRSNPALGPELLSELKSVEGNREAIEDRFCRDLSFGTGGLRGVMGAGSNRMNVHTVAHATRGLAAVLRTDFRDPSCAIAYDSRLRSDVFARTAACVLAAAGVRVYIYPHLMPTPMLSFAVRHLKTSAGIVITASHNPCQYNGYKVYGPDGCQITLALAEKVQKAISAQPDFGPVLPDFEQCASDGRVTVLGRETEEAYYSAVLQESAELPNKTIRVVYTPLNGAGCIPVQNILEKIGNVMVQVVPEQEQPDGRFPTCPYPNPEKREAMTLAVRLGIGTGADLILATDPDCDRCGAAVPDGKGGAVLLTGNETGVLLFDYLCRTRIANGTMPDRPVAVKTIVTTSMAQAVADKYGVELRNVLTGFKFIGEQIGLLEAEGHPERYLFGFEESYGCLSGSYVRDKDAVDASMLLCELASHCKAENRSLLDRLNDLYREFGWYRNSLLDFAFEGENGQKKMDALMEQLRAECSRSFAGYAVTEITDYQRDETGLPKSNVLRFRLEGGREVIIRPSGTEPKLKAYLSVRGDSMKEAQDDLLGLSEACSRQILGEPTSR